MNVVLVRLFVIFLKASEQLLLKWWNAVENDVIESLEQCRLILFVFNTFL